MSDLKTALILDSRIENLTDVESFGVKSSGSQITFQQYNALSATSSLVTFQLQIPSESVVVDRHIRIQSQMTFQINIDSLTNPANGQPLAGNPGRIPEGANVFQWGQTEAFAPFPLTSAFSTIQSTINNCSTSVNIGDIFPQLLRMTSKHDLMKYNSGTPALPDYMWGAYGDCASIWSGKPNGTGADGFQKQVCASNPLGAYNASGYDENLNPRGCFPTRVQVFQYQPDGTTYVSNSPICDTVGNKFKIVVQATFTEPIMLSPFLNCMPHGDQAGFLGLNTLTLNLNVNNLQRCLRTAQATPVATGGQAPFYYWSLKGGCDAFVASAGNPAVAASQLFGPTKLLCQFLTLQPSQSAKIALRNVVPFTDFPRFITNNNGTTPIGACPKDAAGLFDVPNIPSQVIYSNNIQLNQIPSRFIICVRAAPESQNPAYTDSFLPITNVSINFNNKSGILASCPQEQLWELSAKAMGKASQSFLEFVGYADKVNVSNVVATVGAISTLQYPTYGLTQVPTIGSLLVLDSVDLGLDDWLSAGSLGQYNFQMTLTVQNYQNYSIQPQLCIIVCNEGIFSTIAGSSSIMTGLLTKEKVLATKEQEPASDTESYRRFVGGVMSNSSLANATELIKKHYRSLPMGLSRDILGAGSSGGSSSGGRRHLSRHFV